MKTRRTRVPAALRATVFALLISGAVLHLSRAAADEAAPAAEHLAGSWQKHQFSFAFMGFTSTYSCDGLADKLRVLLLAAGARADVKSQPGACASPYGRPDKFARADLTFYTLAPLAGDAAANDKPVDGVWRPVALAALSPWQLQIGDCEVVDQFRTQVLPMFTTRGIENHTTCVPHQESGSLIDLKFQALAAAPVKKDAASAKSAAGAGS